MSNCPNCQKSLDTVREKCGYDWEENRLCKKCGAGCYLYEKEDEPGFRMSWVGKCCSCKEDGQ